ncbi:hypothetical protein SAMN03080610_00162 [Afifella marina DSM 2698]|uniref:Uncharacterized protein n=1 Tax=Afifella marina DSM 2698 TaxID=1120955 RepID=A0A1G5M873_AFIMA|nr:hypothetical protein SAMN03080610_00162 [Afifella marina DSM 2698]
MLLLRHLARVRPVSPLTSCRKPRPQIDPPQTRRLPRGPSPCVVSDSPSAPRRAFARAPCAPRLALRSCPVLRPASILHSRAAASKEVQLQSGENEARAGETAGRALACSEGNTVRNDVSNRRTPRAAAKRRRAERTEREMGRETKSVAEPVEKKHRNGLQTAAQAGPEEAGAGQNRAGEGRWPVSSLPQA